MTARPMQMSMGDLLDVENRNQNAEPTKLNRKSEQHVRDAQNLCACLRFYSARKSLQSNHGAAAMLHRIALVSGGSALIN
jgi:hypothetical protein